MARVLISTPFLDGALVTLGEHELIRGAPGSDAKAVALICDPTQAVNRATQEQMPDLRIIAVAGAGLDAIDCEFAKAQGTQVITAREALAETTADLAFGLIIAASRRMGEAEAALRSKEWTGWQFIDEFGRDVHGATLGLVGFGAIGRAVARRAAGFQMEVLHHTRTPTGVDGWIADLDDLLRRSDVISIHVPLSPSTRHLIDRRRLTLCKPTTVFVNTARGAVVDEGALADALEAGQIFAAGIDVFAAEPAVHSRLMTAPRTVLLPHIGSATLSTRREMLRTAAEAVRDSLAAAH
jgi:glyoxylate reductase